MTPHEFSQAVLAKLASFGAPEPTNQTPRGVLWDLGEPFDEVFLLCEGLPATIVLYSGPTGLHVSHVELPYAAWAAEVAALVLAGPLGCLDTYAEKKIGDLVRAEMAAMDPGFVEGLLSMGDADV